MRKVFLFVGDCWGEGGRGGEYEGGDRGYGEEKGMGKRGGM